MRRLYRINPGLFFGYAVLLAGFVTLAVHIVIARPVVENDYVVMRQSL